MGWIDVASLVIGLSAVVFTYTRSVLLEALLGIVIVSAVRIYRMRRAADPIRRGTTVLIVLLVLIIALFAAFPTQASFLRSRFAEAVGQGRPLGGGNTQFRLDAIKHTFLGVASSDRLLGAGFKDVSGTITKAWADRASMDSLWISVTYLAGVFGIVLVAVALTLFASRALRVGLFSRGSLAEAGGVLACVVLAVLFHTFVSWSFLNPIAGYACDLWPLAFVTALASQRLSETADARTAHRRRVPTHTPMPDVGRKLW
jgi:hypothetical protein